MKERLRHSKPVNMKELHYTLTRSLRFESPIKEKGNLRKICIQEAQEIRLIPIFRWRRVTGSTNRGTLLILTNIFT